MKLKEKVEENKREYKSTMRHLEAISDGIHERRRHSLMVPASSEPFLCAGVRDNPASRRKAVTPELRHRTQSCVQHEDVVKNLTLVFKGSSGPLPTVQASNITAEASPVLTRHSPVSTQSLPTDNGSVAKQVVSVCLSRALTRYNDGAV